MSWLDDATPEEQRAAQLVATARGIPPKPVDLAQFDRVLARAAKPRSQWSQVPVFLVSAAVGALLVLVFRPAAAPSSSFRVEQGAIVQRTPAGTLRLDAGKIVFTRAASPGTVVETPHATLESRACRFSADVTPNGTVIYVDEGELVVRPKGSDERVLRAGESGTWPKAPEIPVQLLDAAPAEVDAACAAEQGDARASCLSREAASDGLVAQAALYELGVFEAQRGQAAASRAAFKASLERFPDGVLHPEVRLGLLVSLVRARQFGAALEQAKAFEASCGTDPRPPQVQQLRRSLEPLAR